MFYAFVRLPCLQSNKTLYHTRETFDAPNTVLTNTLYLDDHA